MMFPEFNYGRQKRESDDNEDGYGKVIFYNCNIAKEVSSPDKSTDPKYSSDYIVNGKTQVAHFPHSGDKGGECAYYRYKARQDNSFSSVFFIKLVGFIKVFFFKETAFFFLEYFDAEKTSDGVIHSIADYCCNWEQDKKPPDIQAVYCRKSPHDK